MTLHLALYWHCTAPHLAHGVVLLRSRCPVQETLQIASGIPCSIELNIVITHIGLCAGVVSLAQQPQCLSEPMQQDSLLCCQTAVAQLLCCLADSCMHACMLPRTLHCIWSYHQLEVLCALLSVLLFCTLMHTCLQARKQHVHSCKPQHAPGIPGHNHTQAKIDVCCLQILGNKSLKIKYLNPSTVFVATGPPEGLLTEDLDPNSIALTVHVVDTVTGAPIYSQTHKVGCALTARLLMIDCALQCCKHAATAHGSDIFAIKFAGQRLLLPDTLACGCKVQQVTISCLFWLLEDKRSLTMCSTCNSNLSFVLVMNVVFVEPAGYHTRGMSTLRSNKVSKSLQMSFVCYVQGCHGPLHAQFVENYSEQMTANEGLCGVQGCRGPVHAQIFKDYSEQITLIEFSVWCSGLPRARARSICGELGDLPLLGCQQPPLGDVCLGDVQQSPRQCHHHRHDLGQIEWHHLFF